MLLLRYLITGLFDILNTTSESTLSMKDEMIKLKSITKHDLQFLYELLSERDSVTNI